MISEMSEGSSFNFQCSSRTGEHSSFEAELGKFATLISELLCTGVPHSASEDCWSIIPEHTEKLLPLLLTRLQHGINRAGTADAWMGMPWTNILQ